MKDDKLKSILKSIWSIVKATIIPAYIFREAYISYAPESIIWWSEVILGMWVMVIGGEESLNGSEKVTNPNSEIEHSPCIAQATECNISRSVDISNN